MYTSIGIILGGIFMFIANHVSILRILPITDILRRTYFTPKLRIEYQEGEQCIEFSKDDYGDGNGAIDRKYLRLAVYNDDVQTAQNCRIVLQRIDDVTPNDHMNVGYNTPTRLLWAKEKGGEDSKGRDLPKGGPTYVDVLYTAHGNPKEFIKVRDCNYYNKLQFDHRYRLLIQGTANGSHPVELSLDIIMKDGWQRFIVVAPEPLRLISQKSKGVGKKKRTRRT